MSFALITGASKGIGKAIAKQLAAKGKDLLLVARNEALLKEACGEIEKDYGVKAYYFPVDLSEEISPGRILDWCKEKGFVIDTLVNNAGFGLSGPFEAHSLSKHLNMMQVNMNAVIQLTYLMLPLLKQQPKSYILNIGSSAGYQSTPYLSLYSASKSFIRVFSRGLHYELRSANVSVTCINPGATDTAFNIRAGLKQKALDLAKKVQMTPDAVAKISIDAMYKGKTEVTTGFLNKLGVFLVWLLPKKFIEGTASKIYQ